MTTTHRRRKLLDNADFHEIMQDEFIRMETSRGWLVGRYVIMPDHVHFFIARFKTDATSLGTTIRKWKEWTAKRLLKIKDSPAPLWQPEFFDHLLRSEESHTEKWNYVRDNPVKAGLVARHDDWPYQGEIHSL